MVGRLGVLSMSFLAVVVVVIVVVAFVIAAVVTALLVLIVAALVRVSEMRLAEVDRLWCVLLDRLDTGGRLLNATSEDGPWMPAQVLK